MWMLLLALGFAADTDLDGLSDAYELALGTDPLAIDSDQDGLPDGREVGDSDVALDFDADGIIDALDDDDDNDTLPTRIEIGDYDYTVVNSEPPNTDGQGRPDYLDLDADNDGDPDEVEGTGDRDCDGVPNYIDGDDASGTCDTGEPLETSTGGSGVSQTVPTSLPSTTTPTPAQSSGCSTAAGAQGWWWFGLWLVYRRISVKHDD